MFKPVFSITPHLAQMLMKIEALKQEISFLPITPKMLASLRETARLASTRYSTYIEGNRLTQEQIDQVIHHHKQIPHRAREEKEVLGYYAALEELEKIATQKTPLTQQAIQHLHALVMSGGQKKVPPTPYRTEQNVIRDSATGRIVYLPPEAVDVPNLMGDLVTWLQETQENMLPHPLRAAIAHYQFAIIHPYIDGNGRTARLLATLILHKSGYGLKGLYSLEEYYAKELQAYYNAFDIGPSHNYYLGHAEADITSWIEYFCAGMLESFEKVKEHALQEQTKGIKDSSQDLRMLDPMQRKTLTLFARQAIITSTDIQKLFKLKPQTARLLCQTWAKQGFLIVVDPAKKSRKYGLNPALEPLLKL